MQATTIILKGLEKLSGPVPLYRSGSWAQGREGDVEPGPGLGVERMGEAMQPSAPASVVRMRGPQKLVVI